MSVALPVLSCTEPPCSACCLTIARPPFTEAELAALPAVVLRDYHAAEATRRRARKVGADPVTP